MKKGSLYYNWIIQRLLADEKDNTPEEIERFIENTNAYDVLSRVNYSAILILQEFIFQITDAINWPEELCDGLLDAIEEKTSDMSIVDKMKSDIVVFQKTEDGKKSIVLALFRVMASAHVCWIRDNMKDYYEQHSQRNEQYLFMPIELIGWSNAKTYLSYIELLIKEFGIEYDEKDIKEAYDQSLIRMLKRNGLVKNFIELCLKDSLIANSLLSCNYESIYEQLIDQDFIKTTLMPQLRANGFGRDKHIVLLMEEEGYFRF